MGNPKINDRKLLRLLDKENMNQSEAARKLGVTRQAVNRRLQELRGKTTKAIVVKKIDRVVDDKLDAVAQLKKINEEANALLDELEKDPAMKLKIMAEIRGQLKLQLDIFQSLFDMRAVQEFQDEILAAIEEAEPDVRKRIIHNINQKRAIRSVVKFN
jgi:predicted transcriptional regulator